MKDIIDLAQKTDEEIVNLVLQDEENFLYLMDRYNGRLLRYIKRISGLNAEDAEDILQEVYIKVFKNLNDFDGSLKFSSWIYRITRNHVISNFRRLKSRPQSVNIESGLLENIAGEIDIEKQADADYVKQTVKKALEKLDIKYREVLVLKFLEEYDYKEISDILKKPMGTVATLINRAKKKFKDEYKKYEHGKN